MSEPIVSIQPWQPNVDAAVHALHDRGVISLKPEFREMHLRDVQVVLETSGAIEEVQRLRALLHAAHFALDTLRAENHDLLNLALESTRAATDTPVDLAAGILRAIAEPAPTVADEVAAPGHVDGWQTAAVQS